MKSHYLLRVIVLFGLVAETAAQLPTPANPRSHSVTTRTATIQWDPVPGADTYRYGFGIAGTSGTAYTTPNTSVPLSGLYPGEKYYWRVRAEKGNPPQEPSEYTPQQTLGMITNPPTSLKAYPITATGATLGWMKPNYYPGVLVSYEYKYSVGSVLIDIVNTNSTNDEAPLAGLMPNTTYTFSVRAQCISGFSEWSADRVFTTLTGSVAGGKTISIPNLHQQYDVTCWAACCEMILDYYKKNIADQLHIITWATQAVEINYLTKHPEEPNKHACDAIIVHYIPELQPTHLDRSLSKTEIVASIEAGRPILVGWKKIDGGSPGHFVVIVGYINTDNKVCDRVVFNDPSELSPKNKDVDYSSFVQGSEYKWTESLIFVISPSDLPTGAPDYVLVSRPARELFLGDSATYTAQFVDWDLSGTKAKAWDWSLVLLHDGGEYSAVPPVFGVASERPSMCRWSARIGVLPRGYVWRRDANNQIMGQVVVGCRDSDPPYFYHTGAIDVQVSDNDTTTITGDKK